MKSRGLGDVYKRQVKDIPSHSVAVGNPCHVIREITDADREYWEGKAAEYHAWKDSIQ